MQSSLFTENRQTFSINFKGRGEFEQILPELQQLHLQYEQKTGIQFENIKELFLHLLRGSAQEPATPPAPEPTAPVLGENQVIIDFPQSFKRKLEEFRVSAEIDESTPIEAQMAQAVMIALNPPAETQPAESPRQENEIRYLLSPEQLEMLDFIREARHRSLREVPEKISRDQQAYELAFNKPTLANWGGGYYTGMGDFAGK